MECAHLRIIITMQRWLSVPHLGIQFVIKFPQSSVQNFMRDRPLFLHSSMWYLAHGVSQSSHIQSGPGSWKDFVKHIL